MKSREILIGYFRIVLFLVCAVFFSYRCSDNDNSFPYGPPRVAFPGDEGAHADSLIEWWYGNFTLESPNGQEYGAMVAYFKPPLRILSVSDIDNGIFYHDADIGNPDYAEGGLDLRWGEHDRWHRVDPAEPDYRIESFGEEIRIELEIVSERDPFLVGGDGLIEWTNRGSYYYSLTRLRVEGELEINGEIVPVGGIGWMDHQWGDFHASRGWDWFSVQLANNTDFIFWQIINPDESVNSRDLTIYFSDDSLFNTRDFTLEKLETWYSLETGRSYGTRWRVIEEQNDIDMIIEARFDEQEITGIAFLPITTFWEGNTLISGTCRGEHVSGVGYAELVRPWEIE